MADDKKKEDANEDGKKKKKGLPAIVMIAIGAIVGGAGVVFAIPPKTVEVKVPAPVFEDVDITHPDVIKMEFNPRQRSGKGVARVSFKFVYTVHQEAGKDDREQAAFEAIKQNWDRAVHKSLLLFKSKSIKELQSDAGMRMLEQDLMDELNHAFFRGDESVAKITEVMWASLLLQ